MFLPGNKYGKGRPRVSLDKPELLLPVIFKKGKVNWANDFIALFRTLKRVPKPPSDRAPKEQHDAYGKYLNDKARFDMYVALMPYLCTKVNVKELDFSKWTTPEDKQHMQNQTEDLLKALEGLNANPKPTSGHNPPSVGTGPAPLPPTA